MSFITNSLGSIGSIAGSLLGGPVGGAIGGAAGGMLTNAIDGGGSSGGSTTSGGTTAAPYNVQNSLANLSQMVGPASAAMQVAQSDQNLANNLQNSALTGEGNATTNAQNSLRNLYTSMPAPSQNSLAVSQVAPQTLSSVMGPGQGRLPQMNSPQATPYATQVQQMAAMPGGSQTLGTALPTNLPTTTSTAASPGVTPTLSQAPTLDAAVTAYNIANGTQLNPLAPWTDPNWQPDPNTPASGDFGSFENWMTGQLGYEPNWGGANLNALTTQPLNASSAPAISPAAQRAAQPVATNTAAAA